jgi:hypothetical protein
MKTDHESNPSEKLNKKNHDGSVNSFHETQKPGHGYTIPISHPEFKSQIEPLIWPHVMLLISKGYVTITSCQGHSFLDYHLRGAIRKNDGPQITLKLRSEREVIKTVNKLNTLFVSCAQNTTMTKPTKVSIRCRFSFLSNHIQRWLIFRSISRL